MIHVLIGLNTLYSNAKETVGHQSAVDLLFSKEDLLNHPKTFHTQCNSFYNSIYRVEVTIFLTMNNKGLKNVRKTEDACTA